MNHFDNVVARLPKSTDPQESRVVDLIQKELLATNWSKDFFTEAKKVQIDFFKSALNNLQNPETIHSQHQELLRLLANLGKTRIVSGEENLGKIEVYKQIFILSNHLGDYKLNTIRPEELELTSYPVDQIHPFPIYCAPYQLIAERFSTPLFEAHVQLPEPLLSVERACGLVTIIANQDGGLIRLENDTKSLFEKYQNSFLVVFPEGGTSGKRNGGGPYDLEEFHTGALVIASHLGVPVLPVAKYFRPDSGYELGVLPPVFIENGRDRDYYKQLADSTKRDLQDWLNIRRQQGFKAD